MLSNEEIRDRIINVTTMILNIEPSQIKNESDFASDLGAESLQSVELVAGFEEEFEIEMDEEEALS
ncbi:TPA: acyl carrier protein, partial [Candidatus Poribacteria bacterium]|nr:acyl carrier protein [Candidatus Poribacteria bacterium]